MKLLDVKSKCLEVIETIEKEIAEKELQERCIKAERELEFHRMQLQIKCTETEDARRELAQSNFTVQQQKSELDRIK